MATQAKMVTVVVSAQIVADKESGIPAFYEKDGETLRKLEKSDFGKSHAARCAWGAYGVLRAEERRFAITQSKTKEDILRRKLARLQAEQAKVIAELGDEGQIDQIIVGQPETDEGETETDEVAEVA